VRRVRLNSSDGGHAGEGAEPTKRRRRPRGRASEEPCSLDLAIACARLPSRPVISSKPAGTPGTAGYGVRETRANFAAANRQAWARAQQPVLGHSAGQQLEAAIQGPQAIRQGRELRRRSGRREEAGRGEGPVAGARRRGPGLSPMDPLMHASHRTRAPCVAVLCGVDRLRSTYRLLQATRVRGPNVPRGPPTRIAFKLPRRSSPPEA